MDDDSWPADSALRKWNALMVESAANLGRYSNSAEAYKVQLQAAGFQNVVEMQFKWPQNPWPKDKHLKKLGTLYAIPSSIKDHTRSDVKMTNERNREVGLRKHRRRALRYQLSLVHAGAGLVGGGAGGLLGGC